MAIFGKADFGLPVITQILQVDPDNQKELIHLVAVMEWQDRNSMGAVETDTFENIRSFLQRVMYDSIIKSIEKGTQPDIDDPFYSPPFEALDAIADVCRLAQDVTTTLFEKGGLSYAQVLSMERLDQSIYKTFSPLRTGGEDIIPISHLFYIDTLSYSVDLWRRFTSQLREVVLRMVNSEALRRCTECENIFPVFTPKSPRVYCSHRCAARAGERRRYTERKLKKDS